MLVGILTNINPWSGISTKIVREFIGEDVGKLVQLTRF